MNGTLTILILVFCGCGCFAQECDFSFEGVVLGQNNEPLPHATVRLQGTSEYQSISDTGGVFTFQGLCPREYTIRVSFVGYEDYVSTVAIPSSAPITVALRAVSTVLGDVVIEGQQASRTASQTVAILEEEVLDALHGKPLGESLKEIPGVSALQTGPSIFKPVIDGLHSQRILILNNGIRQEGQQWGVEHAPEVDPFIASEIQVLKGAETVRYGSAAMGGVIIISPPPLHQTEKIGGELNLGVMSNNRSGVFSAMVEGTISAESRWSWRLQSSVKKGGDYRTPDYNLSNTGLDEFNFSGAIGFKDSRRAMELYFSSFNTELGILRAAHTGNLSDLGRSVATGRPWYVRDFTYDIQHPKQKINHHLIKLSAYQQVKNLGKVTVLYGGQYDIRQEFDIRRSGRNARPAIALTLGSHVLDVSLDHEHAAHSGSVGVNGTFKQNTNDTRQTGVRPLLPDFQQASAGIFVLEKWKGKKWILEAGARYDYQHLEVLTFISNQELIKPQFGFSYLSGTLGATVLFNPRLRLLSNLGLSTRPPHVSELYSEGLHHGTASIEEGLMRQDGTVYTEQSRVRKEYSKKWITTLQYTDEVLSADVSVYYNDIDNYVYIRPRGTRLTVRGYFPVFRYEQTDALLMGSDAAVKWKINDRFTFSSKFSYIYAHDQEHDDVLIFIPPAQWENGLTASIPTRGKVRDLFLGISIPSTFRQHRAPPAVDLQQSDIIFPESTFDFAPAPAGYTLLNARAGFKLPLASHSLGISLSAENLLNKSYRNYMNRLRYYADDIGANFILRLSYNFLSH